MHFGRVCILDSFLGFLCLNPKCCSVGCVFDVIGCGHFILLILLGGLCVRGVIFVFLVFSFCLFCSVICVICCMLSARVISWCVSWVQWAFIMSFSLGMPFVCVMFSAC